MTYRIEFAPEKQRTIEAAAARLGVAVETFIARGAEDLAQNTTQSTVEAPRGFMALLDASAPRIAAGVLRPITSDTITQAIADTRP
jgi:hypothetical protein